MGSNYWREWMDSVDLFADGDVDDICIADVENCVDDSVDAADAAHALFIASDDHILRHLQSSALAALAGLELLVPPRCQCRWCRGSRELLRSGGHGAPLLAYIAGAR